MIADASDGRVSVILITGYLGSGKTTVLNHMLRLPRFSDAAVAINEFGVVPLDQSFVARGERDIMVVAGGCMCCQVGEDFERELFAVHRRTATSVSPMTTLLVETSGLADPSRLLEFLLGNPVASRMFRLSSILCTVDTVFGLRAAPEALAQAAVADVLLLTKTDITGDDGDRHISALSALNPTARILKVVQGRFDPALLHLEKALSFADLRDRSVRISPAPDHGYELAHSHYRSFVLESRMPLAWTAFARWFKQVRLAHSPRLLRVKGLVYVQGEKLPLAIHGVHHIVHPPVPIHVDPVEMPHTKLVFITAGLVEADVAVGWTALSVETVAEPLDLVAAAERAAVK